MLYDVQVAINLKSIPFPVGCLEVIQKLFPVECLYERFLLSVFYSVKEHNNIITMFRGGRNSVAKDATDLQMHIVDPIRCCSLILYDI